VLKANVEQVLC